MRKTLLLLVVFAVTLTASAQLPKTLSLKQGHITYAPTHYHISDIIDDRTDKAGIGRMDRDKLDLQGGAAVALKTFISKQVTQDKTSQPVIVHITKLNFDIRKYGTGWMANAEMALAFYIEDKMLVELSGKGQKETDGDPLEYVDEFIKLSIESDLKRFDTWWGKNKGRVATAATVKVIAKMGRTSNRSDYIVYSTARPLAISDFQGPPRDNGIELAATASGVGYESTGEVIDGQIVLTVTLTPYFSQTNSWFKQGGQNPQAVLAHEQAHFDITATHACELAGLISRTTFNKDTYEKQLEEMMRANTENANRQQATFDEETNHGIIRDKETAWEVKVREAIRSGGCY